MKKYTLIIMMFLVGIAGYLYTSPKSENKPVDVITPEEKEYGSPIIFNINQTKNLDGGLKLTLIEINDSRCPKNVVCVWAGELSAVFKIIDGKSGNTPKEIRLGMITSRSVNESGYTFKLEAITEKTATIIIAKNEISINESEVNGFIHIGPVCPVVQLGKEEECMDRPFPTKIGIYTSGQKLYKTINSDKEGKFTTKLPVGKWIIRPQITNSLPRCEEKNLESITGQHINIDISCDSGIR